MHSQAESTSRSHLAATAPFLQAAAGLGLYLLTLSVEAVLGASVRWLLIFLGAATVDLMVPLGLSAESLAWIGALAPLAHSALGFLLPGRGRLWRRRLGARHPSAEESAALEDAFGLLRSADPELRAPAAIYVLDSPLLEAAVRGRAVVLSRPMLESESLAAVLAHELGHIHSLDGRLTEAVARLTICEDPLAPPADSGSRERPPEFDPGRNGGLLWGALRWTLRLAGGGLGHKLLAPLWASHWRSREYAADAHAAFLEQAEDLVQHLTDFELALDLPQRTLPFNSFQHPPVALRIDRLTQAPTAVSK
jgi:Zn-dependent protease with chaperone function